MSKLHCLNVGKADCFLLELEDRGRVWYILVDGGTRKNPATLPVKYLKKRGIQRLDCVIMTHLHQDHLGYLGEVAETMDIGSAVLPYPPIPLTDKDLEGIKDAERADDIRNYNKLWMALLHKRCPVETTFPLTCPSYRFGVYELRCLYPFPDTASFVYQMLCRLQNERQERIKMMYDSIRLLFNRESSIWILKKGMHPALLMCGDAVHSSLASSIGGYGIRIPVIKLSHHGRNDKGTLYYQPEFIADLEPEKIIIASDKESASLRAEEWKLISSIGELIITGNYKEGIEIPLI